VHHVVIYVTRPTHFSRLALQVIHSNLHQPQQLASTTATCINHSNLYQPQQLASLTKLFLFITHLHEYVIVVVRIWYDNQKSCKESFDAFSTSEKAMFCL
jgi:hypothetical protein